MNINKICILGGSGFVGRHIAHLLTAEKISLVIPTRHRERAGELLALPTVDVVEANIHDNAELDRLLVGVDAVINLVGILHGDFTAAHVELPRKIVAACKRNGIARLLHMSALNASTDAPSNYLRSKGEGESVVMKSGLITTIIRPSVIFGPGDSFLNLFAKLTRFLPVLPLASPDAKFQPVFVENVAHAYAASLFTPATFGQSYNLCGPKIYTLRQLVKYVAHVTGHHSIIIGLNDSLSYLQALTMELLPGKLMTRDNYYSMKVDSICSCDSDNNFTAVFGSRPVALEEAAPRYLGRHKPHGFPG
ncbi:MAG: complex I NDUFA9 subunit family protein [Candidatus Nitrotoga sp.]